jgi:hypothetical protein
MTFLYRHALFVSRRQPYLDWANGFADGDAALDAELSRKERTVYLMPETDGEPELEELIEEAWEAIFEAELAAWHIAAERWPQERTRELFDAWFEVELCTSVYDLAPDEALTQEQVDALEFADALDSCAGCGIDVDDGQGRFVGFKVADRSRIAPWQGRVLHLPVDEEQMVPCIVTADDSDEARAGDDLLVRVCSSGCEKGLRKVVPKALRRFFSSSPGTGM